MHRVAQYAAGALLALSVASAAPAFAARCQLASNVHGVKHIVYIQFDNVHLRRDNPNVPSDLEQMPNLLHFMEREGTLLTNHHTPLISHTSVDILTSLTGVYGEKMALFGNKYVAPALNHSSSIVIKDLDGVAISDGPNGTGNPGFPGFDPSPSRTLGYLAALLEAGVPVVYGYIESAHDNHNFPANPDGAFGPGEAEYVAQLQLFDAAFGKFFARLAADKFTTDNTLFVITSDENDHFAGAGPTPAGCDGIHTHCTYPPGHKGEVDANLNSLFLGEFQNSTHFNIDFDMASGIWIDGNPAQTATVTRKLEQEAANLQGFDPITGGTN